MATATHLHWCRSILYGSVYPSDSGVLSLEFLKGQMCGILHIFISMDIARLHSATAIQIDWQQVTPNHIQPRLNCANETESNSASAN